MSRMAMVDVDDDVVDDDDVDDDDDDSLLSSRFDQSLDSLWGRTIGIVARRGTRERERASVCVLFSSSIIISIIIVVVVAIYLFYSILSPKPGSRGGLIQRLALS
jgi:hypothetical protein